MIPLLFSLLAGWIQQDVRAGAVLDFGLAWIIARMLFVALDLHNAPPPTV